MGKVKRFVGENDVTISVETLVRVFEHEISGYRLRDAYKVTEIKSSVRLCLLVVLVVWLCERYGQVTHRNRR
jgi:hypothetical protein